MEVQKSKHSCYFCKHSINLSTDQIWRINCATIDYEQFMELQSKYLSEMC